MRKIANLDATEIYAKTGINPWGRTTKYRRGRQQHNVNPLWFNVAFTPAQQHFLTEHGYAIRPHPRHNPTVEIFINYHSLTDRDHTILRLLF